jgi:hypothetical protein
MIASGIATFTNTLCLNNTMVSSALSAAALAATLTMIGYSLLLPRVLACHAISVVSTEHQMAIADAQTKLEPELRPSSLSEIKNSDNTTRNNNGPKPCSATNGDSELRERLFRWIASADNPISCGTDDLFDMQQQANRLLQLLRPITESSAAGTVNVVGARGSGKSSLIRLAAEIDDKAQNEKKGKPPQALRFCYLSLWDYANPQAALRGTIDEILELIRDRIDILPLAGISNGIVRAIFGGSNIFGLPGTAPQPSLKLWIPALSELLMKANLRLIFCVEDDDRIVTAARQAEHGEIIQGFLDQIKAFPGFGYILSTSMPAWSEPSPDEAESMMEERKSNNTGNWDEFNNRWPKDSAGHRHTESAPDLNEKELSQIRKEIGDIVWQQRLSLAKRSGFLPVSRLCQYDLFLEPHLKVEDLQLILNVFRTWMVQQILPDMQAPPGLNAAARDLCGINTDNRKFMFNQFIEDFSDTGIAQHITPRTLRNGLREAYRRWLNIVAQLQQRDGNDMLEKWEKDGIDFDSVLVACLLLACLPDRWPNFLQYAGNGKLWTSFHQNLMEQSPGGPQNFNVLHGDLLIQLKNLPLWLGLSRTVWNMLATQDFDTSHKTRPGGIIGNGSQVNWALFLNS